MSELARLAEEGVKRALADGAEAAEVHIHRTRDVRIASAGRFVRPQDGTSEGFGVRVVRDGRVGLSGSSSLAKLPDAARAAIAAARQASGTGRGLRLPSARPEPVRQLPAHPALEALDVDRVSAAAERVALAIVSAPDVTYGEMTLRSWRTDVALANSEGLVVEDRVVGERLEMEIRVTRGETDRSACEVWSGVRPIEEALDVEAFVRASADRARRALDPEPLAPGPHDVILASMPTTQLLGILGNGFSARAAASGQSPLAKRVGEQVASPLVTLRDMPRGPLGVGHRAVDDEGTPTSERVLVDAGRLATLLYDVETAQAEGREPTGNAVRFGSAGGVSIKPLNLVMEPGRGSIDDLVAGAERAVLVTEPLLGAFTANAMTGDFSLSVPFAFLVEKGRIAHALPPTTMGGNVLDVLSQVRAVGGDLRSARGATAPAIRAGGVTCAT